MQVSLLQISNLRMLQDLHTTYLSLIMVFPLLVCKPSCRHPCQLYKGHQILSVYTDNLCFSLGKTHMHTHTHKKKSEIFQRLFWCFSASHKMVQSTNKDGHIITALISALPRSCFDSMGFYCWAVKDGNLHWGSDCYAFVSTSCREHSV